MRGQEIECHWCNVPIIKKKDDHRFCGDSCRKKWNRKKKGKPLIPDFISKKISNAKLPVAQSYNNQIVENQYLPYSNKKMGYAALGSLMLGLYFKSPVMAGLGGIFGYQIGKDFDERQNPAIDEANKAISLKISTNRVVAQLNISRSKEPIQETPPKAKDYHYHLANALPTLSGAKYKLNSKWEYFLNYLPIGFSSIIYGEPKAGKTHFGLQLAQYLQDKFGNVAYVSGEEGTEQPFRDKLKQYKANFGVMDNVKGFDSIANMIREQKPKFVFIDSLTRLGLTVDDVRQFKEQFKDVCFFYIVQATKTGSFRGSLELEHEVTSTINVKKGVAYQKGRTVSAPTEMMIFE